jgi:hypothetical protein
MDDSGGLAAPTARPLAADHGPSPLFVVSAFAAVAMPLVVLVGASVFLPLLRFIAAAYLVAAIALLVVGHPRVRQRFRGEREHSSLAVDEDQVRYTDWQGNQVVCARSAISTVILLLITSRKRTRNLIVFETNRMPPC